VASRPLRVKELAEVLAFDFEEGSTPTFLAEWRPEDPAYAVLSTCSSLLAVVNVDGSPVIQFAHFSVKEYLTSERLTKAKDTVSRFHVSMTPAHTIVAQACLGVLLHLDEDITEDGLEDFPPAEYAAEQWANHARFESVALKVLDGLKRFFDPGKNHLSVWAWLYEPEYHALRFKPRPESPEKTCATPLHYAAFCGMHDIATFLIIEHSQDVNARGFRKEGTPLHVASREGFVEFASILLKHGADIEARDNMDWSPLERATSEGHVELTRVLLEHGANVNAEGINLLTPLFFALGPGKPEVARVLLKHGADVNAQNATRQTPLHRAKTKEVAQILLEHGADANALEIRARETPLHLASGDGRVDVVRVLLEHGVDANARDAYKRTPIHAACTRYIREEVLLDVVRLLLQYGSDIHVVDGWGKTPFMRATEVAHNLEDDRPRIEQFLLENGAEDHRK
jgi:ankyrin repeat protein